MSSDHSGSSPHCTAFQENSKSSKSRCFGKLKNRSEEVVSITKNSVFINFIDIVKKLQKRFCDRDHFPIELALFPRKFQFSWKWPRRVQQCLSSLRRLPKRSYASRGCSVNISDRKIKPIGRSALQLRVIFPRKFKSGFFDFIMGKRTRNRDQRHSLRFPIENSFYKKFLNHICDNVVWSEVPQLLCALRKNVFSKKIEFSWKIMFGILQPPDQPQQPRRHRTNIAIGPPSTSGMIC